MIERADLRDFTTASAPDGVESIATVLAPDENSALGVVWAYFGAADDRRAVRVVVEGENLGCLERDQALALLNVQSRGIGDSQGWLLPGDGDYEGIEVRCTVDVCPANPILAAVFDETYPPHCPVHPARKLVRVQPWT